MDTSGTTSSFWKQEAQLGRGESNSELLLRELMQPGLNPKEHLNKQSRMSEPWSPSLDKNISESFDVHHMAQMNILSLWLQNQDAPPWAPSHPYRSKDAPLLWRLLLCSFPSFSPTCFISCLPLSTSDPTFSIIRGACLKRWTERKCRRSCGAAGSLSTAHL